MNKQNGIWLSASRTVAAMASRMHIYIQHEHSNSINWKIKKVFFCANASSTYIDFTYMFCVYNMKCWFNSNLSRGQTAYREIVCAECRARIFIYSNIIRFIWWYGNKGIIINIMNHDIIFNLLYVCKYIEMYVHIWAFIYIYIWLNIHDLMYSTYILEISLYSSD